jgi:hypothetical protein
VSSRAAALFPLLLAAFACAKVAPPPGGPEDREPLALLEVIPSDGAFAVAPDSALTFVFSEKPDHRSVMSALQILPRVDFREVTWTEGRLRLLPEEGWAEDRNTIVRITESAHDRRGNSMRGPFQSRFTTKQLPDSGAVTGRIWKGKEVAPAMKVLVGAYPVSEADSVDPSAFFPAALAEAGGQGKFRLDGLDVAESYHVIGMSDRDGDARPAAGDEVWSALPEPILFAAGERAVEVPDFLVGTLDTMGVLAGQVLVDSASVAVVFAAAESDGKQERQVLPDGGDFSLSVPTGARYRVGAFVDTDGDSLAGTEESVVELEEVVSLELTSERSGIQFDMRTPLGEELTTTPPGTEEEP